MSHLRVYLESVPSNVQYTYLARPCFLLTEYSSLSRTHCLNSVNQAGLNEHESEGPLLACLLAFLPSFLPGKCLPTRSLLLTQSDDLPRYAPPIFQQRIQLTLRIINADPEAYYDAAPPRRSDGN